MMMMMMMMIIISIIIIIIIIVFKSLVRLDPRKISAQAGFEPRIFRSRGGR